MKSNLDCILINRVSSARQVEGYSLDAQSKKGREYINNEKRGYKILEEFTYQESGSKEHEAKKFREIKRFIATYNLKNKNKELQVIVEKDDRLGRNHERKEYIQNLARGGYIALHLYATNEIIHKNSPPQVFFIQDMNTSVDKFKAMTIGVEAIKGMRERASQGWLPHKPPIGYLNNRNLDSSEKIIVNENERALVERIFSLRGNEGASYAVIASMVKAEGLVPDLRLPTFRKSNVEKILKNKFYGGRFKYGDNEEEYEGKHELIVTPALFLKVLKSFENPLRLSKRKHNGVFAGFLKCAECGCQITYNEKTKPSGNVYYFYVCANGKKAHPTLRGMYAVEEKIMEQFSRAFDEINISYELAEKISKALNADALSSASKFKSMTERLMEKINGLNKLDVKAYEDFSRGLISEMLFTDLRNKNELQRLEAQEMVENLKLENTSRKLETAETTLELAKNAKTLWNSLNPHERVDLLKMILWNQKLRALTIEYELKKPFKILSEMKGLLNNEEWGG